jgi:hypothetical protein
MIMQEARIDETRAQRLDLAARAEFAAEGERIHETRMILHPPDEQRPELKVAGTEQSFIQASAHGFVEVG